MTILYDRGGDACVVELRRDGELVDRHDRAAGDMLGEVLERLIEQRTLAPDRRRRGRRQSGRRQAV